MANVASRVEEGQDIIDSRDVIARIEELEAQPLDAANEVECSCAEKQDDDGKPLVPEIATCGSCKFEWCFRCEPTPASRCPNEYNHLDEDEAEELNALRKLAEEGEGCSDWQYGEALIADHYFEQYAEQLADDIGAIDAKAKWPLNHIDWKAAAEELKQDYSLVTFGETEYWIRS